MMQCLSPAEEYIVEQLQHSLHADFTAILLLSKTDGKLHVIFQMGSRSKRTSKLAFKTNEGIAAPVFKSGRSFISSMNSEPASLLFHTCPLLLAERLTSIISVPLLQDQTPVGILITGLRNHSRPFHPSEIQVVEREADQLSTSMTNILNVI